MPGGGTAEQRVNGRRDLGKMHRKKVQKKHDFFVFFPVFCAKIIAKANQREYNKKLCLSVDKGEQRLRLFPAPRPIPYYSIQRNKTEAAPAGIRYSQSVGT